ncbi:unnamed protein product [Closterium sp. NIES-54]
MPSFPFRTSSSLCLPPSRVLFPSEHQFRASESAHPPAVRRLVCVTVAACAQRPRSMRAHASLPPFPYHLPCSSPPGYYFRAGTGSGSQNWHIHLPSGGWCVTVAACAQEGDHTAHYHLPIPSPPYHLSHAINPAPALRDTISAQALARGARTGTYTCLQAPGVSLSLNARSGRAHGLGRQEDTPSNSMTLKRLALSPHHLLPPLNPSLAPVRCFSLPACTPHPYLFFLSPSSQLSSHFPLSNPPLPLPPSPPSSHHWLAIPPPPIPHPTSRIPDPASPIHIPSSDLQLQRGFGSASQILLSGSSAGGQATANLCDWLASSFPSASTRCLVDAGFFLDTRDRFSKRTFRALAQNLTSLHRPVNPSCSYARRSEQWKCFFLQHTLLDISTPIFLFQAPFDCAAAMIEGIEGSEGVEESEAVEGSRNAKYLRSSLTHGSNADGEERKTTIAEAPQKQTSPSNANGYGVERGDGEKQQQQASAPFARSPSSPPPPVRWSVAPCTTGALEGPPRLDISPAPGEAEGWEAAPSPGKAREWGEWGESAEWAEVDLREITLTKEIARGSSSVVYRGVYRKQSVAGGCCAVRRDGTE